MLPGSEKKKTKQKKTKPFPKNIKSQFMKTLFKE